MTAKQRLIKLIDEHEISEATADEIEVLILGNDDQNGGRHPGESVVDFLRRTRPPVEPTPDEIAALEEADADDPSGARTYTLDEIKRELNLS